MVEELVSKGEVAKKDARQFASELVKKGEEQREEFKNLIQEELRKGLENADIAKKEDILTSDEIRQIVREQIQQVLYEQGVFQSEEQENE
jgi:polyhydroxyalkanoate synthesis regulator phasin